MEPLGRDLPAAASAWLVTALVLAWPALTPTWRRWLALASSAAGLAFLILALGAEGEARAASRSVFLFGQSYVTELSTAAASLSHYALSAFFLVLGTTALAVTDKQVSALRAHWLGHAIGWSVVVTALRFALEKVAAPPALARAAGITWLPPLVGAYFALQLRAAGAGRGALTRALLAYGFATRGAVAAFVAVTTAAQLGSHYDLSALTEVVNPITGAARHYAPGSAAQVWQLGILPQMLFWPFYTLVAGLLGGAPLLLFAAAGRRVPGGDDGQRGAPTHPSGALGR